MALFNPPIGSTTIANATTLNGKTEGQLSVDNSAKLDGSTKAEVIAASNGGTPSSDFQLDNDNNGVKLTNDTGNFIIKNDVTGKNAISTAYQFIAINSDTPTTLCKIAGDVFRFEDSSQGTAYELKLGDGYLNVRNGGDGSNIPIRSSGIHFDETAVGIKASGSNLVMYDANGVNPNHVLYHDGNLPATTGITSSLGNASISLVNISNYENEFDISVYNDAGSPPYTNKFYVDIGQDYANVDLYGGSTTLTLYANSSNAGISVDGYDVWHQGNLSNTENISFVIDGNGSPITTGSKGIVQIPFNGEITGWTILSDVSGSIVVDVKKAAYANYPTTTSITSTDKPTITSAFKGTNQTLTVWTTTVTSGDIFEFVVDSASTVTRALVTIFITRGT